jgi:protocatechuate 3,4-dioxygenase beta subunit
MTAADFSEQTSAEIVAASFAAAPDPRLRQVMASLVRHLHAFVRDIEPTEDEWAGAIEFLTATGQACGPTRQEFILLSDVLGVSMLVDAIAHRLPDGATESTVLGPFHLVASPEREPGADICLDGKGEPCLVAGRVRALDGTPLAGATVEVWQANGEGFYDVQQPGVQPERNLRGLFTTDAEGRFRFRSVVPVAYPIPDDGPVGALLHRAGRHPYRPAHLHVIAGAPGHLPVTTHVFLAGDPYLGSDPVFGVKRSLVRELETVDDEAEAARHGLRAPFRRLGVDLTLQPQPA